MPAPSILAASSMLGCTVGGSVQLAPWENRFRRRSGFSTVLISHALPFAAARRDERGEPAVRYRTVAAVPPSRYEVILVSPVARRRLRGRRRRS
jgi:hypothetical protein